MNSIFDGFLKRKNSKGSAYNYDLYPLIENFDFYEFISSAENSKEDLMEHGAFLVITNRQYIIGYNAGFGFGTHISANARVMKELLGGGFISSTKDAIKLNEDIKQFITAKIFYEYMGDDKYSRPIYSGCINFNLCLNNNKITKKQFEVFKMFYNDYNDDLKYVINKYGINKFHIKFCYNEKDNSMKQYISDSLDELYNYLENNIDYSKEVYEENIIIGKELSNHLFIKN